MVSSLCPTCKVLQNHYGCYYDVAIKSYSQDSRSIDDLHGIFCAWVTTLPGFYQCGIHLIYLFQIQVSIVFWMNGNSNDFGKNPSQDIDKGDRLRFWQRCYHLTNLIQTSFMIPQAVVTVKHPKVDAIVLFSGTRMWLLEYSQLLV